MSGEHSLFIWLSYGVAAIVLVGLWLASQRALKGREAELERAEAALPRTRR